jgi:hypothetical protein
VTAPEISRPDAFLAISRRVITLIEAVQNLAWQILEKAAEERQAEERDSTVVGVAFHWDDAARALAEAKAALAVPVLQASALSPVLQGLSDQILQAERQVPPPGEWYFLPIGLQEAAEEALFEVADLERWLERMAVAVFGHWGMHWWKAALDAAPAKVFSGVEHCDMLDADALVSMLLTPELTEREQEWERVLQEAHRWVYEQVMAGVKYGNIVQELKAKPTRWPRYSSIPGIKGVARKYAKDHGPPVPELRKPGRPPGS